MVLHGWSKWRFGLVSSREQDVDSLSRYTSNGMNSAYRISMQKLFQTGVVETCLKSS